MKSSKIENIFNYQPPLEDSNTPSPFTFFQPLQANFDPRFTVPQPKSTPWQNPTQGEKWNQGAEKTSSSFQMSEGGIPSLWNLDNRGFGPEASAHVKSSFPSTSTSVWGGLEARRLCNSTWSNEKALRPPFSAHEENQSPRYLMSGMSDLEMHSQFLQKNRAKVKESSFGSPNGPPYHTESSIAQSIDGSASFDGTLSQPTYYPLMLNPMGTNIGQNVYKTGPSRPMVCNFCKNNKEVPDIYLDHYLYDPETKVLTCPVLRKHVCKICGGTGDQAHTLQYCPVNKERGFQSKVPILLKTRTITNSTGKIRRN